MSDDVVWQEPIRRESGASVLPWTMGCARCSLCVWCVCANTQVCCEVARTIFLVCVRVCESLLRVSSCVWRWDWSLHSLWWVGVCFEASTVWQSCAK